MTVCDEERQSKNITFNNGSADVGHMIYLMAYPPYGCIMNSIYSADSEKII